jgi:septal ring factor EnvC (AmiA/AmiB activator)
MANDRNSKTSQELEELICRLELRRDRIDHSLADLKRDRQQVTDQLNSARQALERQRSRKAAPAEPAVSSHALLRFIERVLEVNVDMIREHILSPDNRAAIAAGATKIIAGGVTLVIKDGVVVTVLD